MSVSSLGINFLCCFHMVPVLVNIDTKYLIAYITNHDVSYEWICINTLIHYARNLAGRNFGT